MKPVGWKIYDTRNNTFYRGGGRWSIHGKLYSRKGDMTSAIRLYWSTFQTIASHLVIVTVYEGESIPFCEMYDENLNTKLPR